MQENGDFLIFDFLQGSHQVIRTSRSIARPRTHAWRTRRLRESEHHANPIPAPEESSFAAPCSSNGGYDSGLQVSSSALLAVKVGPRSATDRKSVV